MKLTHSADPHSYAASVAADFNARHGGTFLRAVAQHEPLTVEDIHTWQSGDGFHPGHYMAAAAFETIRGRKPEHGEAIASGRVLKTQASSILKAGPYTLYVLDKLPASSAD